MSQAIRSALVFAFLLVAVVLASMLYLRYTSRADRPSDPQAEATEARQSLPTSPAVEAAARALHDGKLDEARELLVGISPLDPGYHAALENLAAVELRLGNLEDSRQALVHLATLRPDDAQVQLGLSVAHYRLAEYRDAELAALRSFELRPDDPRARARFKIGLYRVAQGRIALAIDTYHRALEAPGAQDEIFDALGALSDLESREPDLPAVHYASAYFASRLGRREDEIAALERYLSMQQSGPAAVNAREQLEKARAAAGAEG